MKLSEWIENKKNYPDCKYRYNPIGWELCDYGNEGIERHKKRITSCCANSCPLELYPESMKMTCEERYRLDMEKLEYMKTLSK